MPVALERFANAAQTTLSAAMTNVQTTASVASSSGFPTQNVAAIQYRILVDSEIMIVTAGSGTTTWTVTRGVEGTTAAAHTSGASVTHLVTQGALERWLPAYAWQPRLDGWTLANIDPAVCSGQFVPSSGFIYLHRIWVPETVAISNLIVNVSTAGATLTAGQSLAGLYNPQTGAVLCQTADQSTVWNSTGTKNMAITGAPVTITGGPDVYVWGALLSVGTTPPKFGGTPIQFPNFNFNLASGAPGTATFRAGAESAGGRTSLISLSGLSLINVSTLGIPFIGAT